MMIVWTGICMIGMAWIETQLLASDWRCIGWAESIALEEPLCTVGTVKAGFRTS